MRRLNAGRLSYRKLKKYSKETGIPIRRIKARLKPRGFRSNPEHGGMSLWTIALIGVGGYFLWSWWSSLSSVATTTTTPGTTTGTQTPVTSLNTTPLNATTGTSTTAPTVTANATANLSSPLAVSIMNQIAATVSKLGYSTSTVFNGWQWNYFASNANLGSNMVDISLIPSLAGASMYTFTQYMQQYLNVLANTNAGLQGLGCDCDGLGAVTNTSLMYKKMLGRTGWAVGDFAGTKANASEGNWVN